MKNKILWPVLFLCTLPVQAQQDMTEAEGSVTLQVYHADWRAISPSEW